MKMPAGVSDEGVAPPPDAWWLWRKPSWYSSASSRKKSGRSFSPEQEVQRELFSRGKVHLYTGLHSILMCPTWKVHRHGHVVASFSGSDIIIQKWPCTIEWTWCHMWWRAILAVIIIAEREVRQLIILPGLRIWASNNYRYNYITSVILQECIYINGAARTCMCRRHT